MKNIYSQIHEKILESKNIALVSHRFPDGDTLGSITAMKNIIETNFKNKNVDMICFDILPEKLSFLHGSENIINKFDGNRYDICIFLDIGNIILTGFGERSTINCSFLINIDHHQSNIGYGDINLVDMNRPSTTAVLFDFIEYNNYKINSDIATSFLTGIYTDTGAFIYSNVKPKTFSIASKLVEMGGDIKLISSNFFLNNTFDFIKLFGLTLERLKVSKKGVAISYLTKEDILSSGCKYEELDGIVWRLNMLDNKKYVIFIYEKGDIVKGSFRTSRDDVDLTKIASKYNGGGHRKACGLTLDGQLSFRGNNVFVKMYDGSEIDFLND